MDSIGVYKDKLNEALTMIPSMSHPKKLEAVSYWNTAATYFQNIVNCDNDSSGQTQPTDGEQSCGQNFETTVDISPVPAVTCLTDGIDNNSLDRPMTMALDLNASGNDIVIDPPSGQFGVESILNEPPFSLVRDVIEETGQNQNDTITNELLSGTTFDSSQPNNLLSYTDNQAQSCRDLGLKSLEQIDACSQQFIISKSSSSCLLLHNTSVSSFGSQADVSSINTINSMPQASFCSQVGIDNNQLQNRSLENPNVAGDLDNQNRMSESCIAYSDVTSKDTTNSEIVYDPEKCLMERDSEIEASAPHQLEVSSNSLEEHRMNNSCNNRDSDDERQLEQIHVHMPPTLTTSEFSLGSNSGDDQMRGQLVVCETQPSQPIAVNVMTHMSPNFSLEIVNESTCHQQTKAPANIDSVSSPKSDKSPHTCEICGKTGFSTKGNLKRHQKAHSGEKPFKCEFCGARFTENKSLKIHMRKHSGEKPFKCDICHQFFSQAPVLKSHMTTHIDERKYFCPRCDKAFKQSSQLRLHVMRHEGIKKLGCTKCPSRFLTKGDLERHFRIHTGERPYSCQECGKRFTRQQSLNEHLNRHYGKKPFSCNHCHKEFSEMSACYKHKKLHNESERQRQRADSLE